MANRIIQLTEVDSSPKSNESLQKWVDIDMEATRNWNYKQTEIPYLSDYYKWLNTELKTNVGGTINNLSTFAVEANHVTSEQISAIAVEYKIGYDTACSLYRKWMKPYKWRISKLVNVKAVQNSLKNIFSWIPGERILNPEFGTKLRQYLYQGITPETSEQIMAEIRHCVSEWEPRVNIVKVIDASSVDDHEDNTIHLEIIYTIPELSDDEYNYSFYYTRGS